MNQTEEPPDPQQSYTQASYALRSYSKGNSANGSANSLITVADEMHRITDGNLPRDLTRFMHACEEAYKITPSTPEAITEIAGKLEGICRNPESKSKQDLAAAADFFYHL